MGFVWVSARGVADKEWKLLVRSVLTLTTISNITHQQYLISN